MKNDPLYRARQFFRALRAAPLTSQEQERVRAVLSPAAFALYQTMPLGDQRHSLKIFDALCEQGNNARPLLQAALLHDVAKRNVGLVHRTGVILLKRFAPNAFPRVASAHQNSWRYPFYVSLHHPEMGTQLAANVGVENDALPLIRAHQETMPVFERANAAQLSEWHRALKLLDDVN